MSVADSKLDVALADLVKKRNRRGRNSSFRSPQKVKRAGGVGPFRGGFARRGKGFVGIPGNVEKHWQHDLFSGPGAVAGGGLFANIGVGAANAQSNGVKMLVSNLHSKVDDNDMRELFGEVGQLKKVSVHYDSNGRSLGTAEIIFMKKGDAAKARARYAGLSLDGKPLQMSIVDDEPARSSIVTRVTQVGTREFAAPLSRTQGFARRGGRGGMRRGGGRPNGSNRRQLKTADELNAELDDYMIEDDKEE